MRPANASEPFHVEVDTKECTLSAREQEHLQRDLEPLEKSVARFPSADLYVTIDRHARSGDYRIKTSLVLPSGTLFTGEWDQEPMRGVGRCIRKLMSKVQSHKAELDNEGDKRKYAKGTHQDVEPGHQYDPERVQQALDEEDYAAFRDALLMFEESVRKRAGRWIQRYPQAEAELGDKLKLADIVEEVILNAFEKYTDRREGEPLGQWLEALIDPSIKQLMANPEEALQNISFARTLREET